MMPVRTGAIVHDHASDLDVAAELARLRRAVERARQLIAAHEALLMLSSYRTGDRADDD